MYITTNDIHAARDTTLDFCHHVSRRYLDYFGHCLDLGSGVVRRMLQTGSARIQALGPEVPASQWLDESGRMGAGLLKEDVPAYVGGVVHASASCAEEVWSRAERHLTEFRHRTDDYFERGLKWSPWEAYWWVNTAKRAVGDGFDTANQLSELAIAAVDRFDEHVEEELKPASRRKGNR